MVPNILQDVLNILQDVNLGPYFACLLDNSGPNFVCSVASGKTTWFRFSSRNAFWANHSGETARARKKKMNFQWHASVASTRGIFHFRVRGEAGVVRKKTGASAQGVGFMISGCRCGISGFGFWVSGFDFWISGFGCRFSVFVFRISGFGFRVSGLEFTAPRMRISGQGIVTSLPSYDSLSIRVSPANLQPFSIQAKLIRRIVKWFRGGLARKAQTMLHHTALGLRIKRQNEKICRCQGRAVRVAEVLLL